MKTRPVAKAKAKKTRAEEEKQKQPPGVKSPERGHGWVVCGFDTSMSSIAGAAIAYDSTLKKYKGPVFKTIRWSKNFDYFSRLLDAARGYEMVLDLQAMMNVSMGVDEIFIAQEEPWPLGMAGFGKTSGFLKQQAEISGAFLGGLVRYGLKNVAQMNSTRWRQMIASDLGITIHHSKWRDPKLAAMYNCKPEDSGKFRSKQWARGQKEFMGAFENKIPDLPDIIESTKLGKIPRPEGSKARAVQPEDIYDALAIAWTFSLELAENGTLEGGLTKSPRDVTLKP